MKFRYNEVSYDEGTWNLVRYSESSLYPGLVIPREFIRSLLVRIPRGRTFGSLYLEFVISGFHCV